jgi:hypothetical protein
LYFVAWGDFVPNLDDTVDGYATFFDDFVSFST